MKNSISEIREIYQAASVEALPEFINKYSNDERAGVRRLTEAAQKRLEALEKEKQRIEALCEYEKKYRE